MTALERESPQPASVGIVEGLKSQLCNESSPLALRFRALFSLKHLAKEYDGSAADEAVLAIAAAFDSPSALLKHELAYCLGQSRKAAATNPLRRVLENLEEDPMCRHEAAEGLAALGDVNSLPLLRYFRDREGEAVVVRETCEIAIDRIEWQQSEQSKKEKLKTRCGINVIKLRSVSH